MHTSLFWDIDPFCAPGTHLGLCICFIFLINCPPKALLDASDSCHSYANIWYELSSDFKSVFNLKTISNSAKVWFSGGCAFQLNYYNLNSRDSESLTVISDEHYCKVNSLLYMFEND